jgi:virulence-associated protein VapD
MKNEIIKDRRIQTGIAIVIITIILLLLKSCGTLNTKILTIDEFNLEVEDKVKEEEIVHDEWNNLLGDIGFEDLCSSVYSEKINSLGDRMLEIKIEFENLDIKEDKETAIEKYSWYESYFNSYEDLGNALKNLSTVIEQGDYQEAVNVIDQLQELNKAIPIIE